VTEADVKAPTDPESVEPMTGSYHATRTKNTPHRRGVEWRGLKGVRGVTEADVTAPTDPESVEPMTECYDAARPKNTLHRRGVDPVSVDVMLHADGTVLGFVPTIG
jgi:hypothetical protein